MIFIKIKISDIAASFIFTKVSFIFLHFSQAVIVDRTMYISGQIGLDPAKMEIVDGGVVQEADRVMPFHILHANLDKSNSLSQYLER